MKKLGLFILFLLVVGCGNFASTAVEVEPEQPVEQEEEPTLPPTDAPVEVETEPEPPSLEFQIAGEEEIVFDWTSDRCEQENIPDIAPRAWRDAEGIVHLTIGHLNTYRMSGPDLDNLTSDCTGPIMRSDLDPDPAMFNDGEWIGSVYTEDGQTIYAMIHNEYRGHLHPAERPGQCPSGDYLTCLDTSITMAKSTDGGRTFQDIAEPPNHMVATMPYVFNDQGVPSGLRQPSNIIEGPDGYFYVYTNISDYPETLGEFPPQWVCVMRTDNLDDPSAWRYWDGSDFNGVFVNPYVEAVDENTEKCAPLDIEDISGGLTDSVTYNTLLEKYVLVGFSAHPASTADKPMWGVYYSLSDDLIEWTQRKLLIELPLVASVADPESELIYAYPVLIDPNSDSPSFHTTDDELYLYVSKFNFGSGSLDRDVVRYPVVLTEPTFDIPEWTFDTDGDVEGWFLENHLELTGVSGSLLTMQSTGDDPYMVSPGVEFPASQYSTLNITMSVSGGDLAALGQVFFTTDTDAALDENKSLVFDVLASGEFKTYELDMSASSGWQGIIQQIRLDPADAAGLTIEIDSITVSE